jgi:hypothetical protein
MLWRATVPFWLQIEFSQQFLDVEFVVRGYGLQDTARQGAGFQRAMIGNRNVVPPANCGRQSNMGAVLSCALINGVNAHGFTKFLPKL